MLRCNGGARALPLHLYCYFAGGDALRNTPSGQAVHKLHGQAVFLLKKGRVASAGAGLTQQLHSFRRCKGKVLARRQLPANVHPQ